MQQNEHLNRAPEVDYQLLAVAQEYYGKHGYEYVHLPWATPSEINCITFNNPAGQIRYDENYVWVGSAEQSFIWWAKQGKLDKNKNYMSITPCFRREPKFDDLYYMYFMKLELFSQILNIDEMINCAYSFYIHCISKKCEIIKTDIGLDIVKGDIELGSYGQRQHKGLKWTYGTGIAFPRASICRDI